MRPSRSSFANVASSNAVATHSSSAFFFATLCAAAGLIGVMSERYVLC